MSLITMLGFLLTMLAATQAPGGGRCRPTEAMEDARRGSRPALSFQAAPGEGPVRHLACGDFNEDGIEDLCAVLVGQDPSWSADCFLSAGSGGYRVENLDSHDDPAGGSRRGRPALYVERVPPGQKLEWAGGAAVMHFRRDCVEFGTEESSARIFCYNGAYFLYLWMSD